MTAVLSADHRYRYWLTRDLAWDLFQPGNTPVNCAFVMLNPSTADGERDDPTIRRCLHFAQALGASQLVVANLYGYRATDPRHLWQVDDPVGPENLDYLRHALDATHVVVAWGGHARSEEVERFLQIAEDTALWCLGTTRDGAPRHPLYVANAVELQRWPTTSGEGS